MSFIEFALTPMGEIPLEEEDGYKSWFFLSDGFFRLKFGPHYLFNFSSEYLAFLDGANGDSNQLSPQPHLSFIDYFVARIWEDLIDVAPYALQEVPTQLRRLTEISWLECSQWHDRFLSTIDVAENEMESLECFGEWYEGHFLPDHYLHESIGQKIGFWNLDGQISVNWESSYLDTAGLYAWSSPNGTATIEPQDFLDGVNEFNLQFINEMRIRVEELCQMRVGSHTIANMNSLVEDHAKRKQRWNSRQQSLGELPLTEDVIEAFMRLNSLLPI